MEWDTGIKLVERPTIQIRRHVINKIAAMSKEIAPNEWGGYLLGHDMFVDDIFVTEQEVTATEWSSKKKPDNPDVIGTAHSHHTMGAFASGTDDEYILTTYPINIIYSFKDGVDTFLTFYTMNLPSGNKLKVEANIEIIDEDVTDWINENKPKIKEQQPVVYQRKGHKNTLHTYLNPSTADPLGYFDGDEEYYTDANIPAIPLDVASFKKLYALYGCDECGTKKSGKFYHDMFGDQILCDKCAKGMGLADQLIPDTITAEEIKEITD